MAQGRKTQIRVVLMKEIRRELESWQRSSTISAGLARRGRIILLLADRTAISEVSRLVGIERRHVYKWVQRFLSHGLDGLCDQRRGSRLCPSPVLPIAEHQVRTRQLAPRDPSDLGISTTHSAFAVDRFARPVRGIPPTAEVP